MGILQTMCLFQIFFGILISPMIAFCQFLDTVIRYFEDGKHPTFYRNIKIYLLFILVYLKLWLVFWISSKMDIIPDSIYLNIIVFILFIVPIALVKYNYNIINKDYPSSLKKQ